MIASFRQVQKSPKGELLCSGWPIARPQWRAPMARPQWGAPMSCPLRLLLFKERPKLISPIHIVRMSSLQRHELLTCRGCIAPKLRQEINNSALLGDLPFRDIQLSNSLNEIIHDSLSVHSPTTPPVIRPRWWLSHTAELREALNFSVCYVAGQARQRVVLRRTSPPSHLA